jgi:hypothetical protein
MSRIYFVGQQWVQENLPMSLNVDANSYNSWMASSEEIFIQQVLSSPFYEEMISIYSCTTLGLSSMTQVQQELVSYIKPAEGWKMLSLAFPFLVSQIKEKGPQIGFDDYSAGIDLDRQKYLQEKLDNNAEFYMQRLQNYLSISGASYPNYILNNPNAVIQANPKEGRRNMGMGFYN